MFTPDSHPLQHFAFPRTADEWRDAPAQVDASGLTILGHPVMQSWEEPYMAELAKIATMNGGRVLEIGFGMGISASFIQRHSIDEHWVIEANRQVFDHLVAFAATARHAVHPLLGFWEEVVTSLPAASFDGILFDPYPINLAQLHTQRFSFFEEAFRLLRPGGVFTHYSGEVEFTPEYRSRLSDAGFERYEGTLCKLTPPPGCAYWDEPCMLAPVIRR